MKFSDLEREESIGATGGFTGLLLHFEVVLTKYVFGNLRMVFKMVKNIQGKS